MLCIDYPAEVLNGILKMLDKKEEENVDFDEFLNGIKTIMLYDNYFEEMESLFKYLDSKKQGKIKRQEFIDAVGKLRRAIEKHNQEDAQNSSLGTQNPKNQQNYRCELKVPNEDELDHVCSQMMLMEDDMLNYDEYLISLFRVTMES